MKRRIGSYDWRPSPTGVRLHASGGFTALCGVPVCPSDDGTLRDKCYRCCRIITSWPVASWCEAARPKRKVARAKRAGG